MKEFWNERYSKEEYAYGTEPNAFLKSQLLKLEPGRILFPADGEGRNSVFAAALGWEVVAFDNSEAGRRKALDLAKSNQVSIDYRLIGYEDFEDISETYDAIGLIFTHMPEQKRALYHDQFIQLLKPSGRIILEGFSSAQLGKSSGGPKNLEMLFTEEIFMSDFGTMKELQITEAEVEINEGLFHSGPASVIRLIGIK